MNFIKDITEFIFIEDVPQKADIIFIPGGSWPETAEKAAHLWLNDYSMYILPSGKYSVKRGMFPGSQTKKDIYDDVYKTEWEFLRSVLIKQGVKDSVILKEDEACEKGTYDNAFMSKEVTNNLGLSIKKAIICCKAFHARRCLMFYSWAYPDVEFFVCPVETENINRDNWYNSENGIERVMGELYRCGAQFKEAIPVFKKIF